MRIGWVMYKDVCNDSCSLARVLRPHEQLLKWGIDSHLFGPKAPTAELLKCDVLIFHRAPDRVREVAGRDIVLGYDLADDLLRHEYASLPIDFILTDSLPNARFYLSRHTHYWPHGFPDQSGAHQHRDSGVTKFVYCGAPENVHCLLGDPLNALETVGARHPLSLTIITNLDNNEEPWLAKLPKIEPRNYRLEWLPFSMESHERQMQQYDVGLFPQAIDKDRWRKKSVFKPTHAASLGLPSISSPTEEACMTFLHKQTALLPHTAEEWIEAVEMMVDPEQRRRVRQNAIDLHRLRFTVEVATQQVLAIARYHVQRARAQRFKSVRRTLLRSFLLAERILDAVQRRLPHGTSSPRLTGP